MKGYRGVCSTEAAAVRQTDSYGEAHLCKIGAPTLVTDTGAAYTWQCLGFDETNPTMAASCSDPKPGTLQLCQNGIPIIPPNASPFILSLASSSTANMTAYFDSDISSGHQCDAGSTDVTASTTFTEANPSGGVISLSANGTNPRVFTAASTSGSETVTATYSGQTATMNINVTCVETANCTAEKAAVCTGSTVSSGTTKVGTCGTIDCSGQQGTRYCDMNWKEVAPGQ